MVAFDLTKPVDSSDLISSEIRNQLNALHKGDLFPLRPRAQTVPDLTVAVGASLVEGFWLQTYLGTRTPLNYAGGNSPAVTAPSANPRIDLLTINSAGTLAWVVGTEAASPAAPSCPNDVIPICYIYCRVGMVHIHNFEDDDSTNGYIYRDVRPIFTPMPVAPMRNFLHNGVGAMQTRKAAYTLVKDVWGVGWADRWWGMATGTLVSAGMLTYDNEAPIGSSKSAFKFAGVTLTGTGILYLRQRLLASSAAAFMNKQGSFQLRVYHDVGSAVNFTIIISKADALNTWTTQTEITNSGTISVPSGTETLLTFEDVTMADCHNGVEVKIKIECGAITTKNFWLTELKGEPQAQCSPYVAEQHMVEIMEVGYLTEKSQQSSIQPDSPWAEDSGVGVQIGHPTGWLRHTIPFKIRKDHPTPTIHTYDRTGAEDKFSWHDGTTWHNGGTWILLAVTETNIIVSHSQGASIVTAFTWYAPEWL